jgi:ABC-type nitrate/sulfonate/bicarbonate transport system ATPase subunit
MYEIGKTLLTLNSVSLSFGSNLILRDINLELKDIIRTGETTGQVVTLIGESGIGKSQLLKMIAGLQKPSSGEILVGLEQKPTKAGVVGLVDQKYPLFQHRSLMSNLKLVSSDKDRIESYLTEFSLQDHRDKYPSQLSGGQRQRAAIVQQLLCSDHMILLDEPISGLDLKAIDKFCNIVQKIASLDELNTIIISSHILEPALALSDHVWILGYEYADINDNTGLISLFDKMKAITKGETKVKIPGAVIRYSEDLAARGLSWKPDIRYDQDFINFVKQVEKTFKSM